MTSLREYGVDTTGVVDITKLKTGTIPKEEYGVICSRSVIPCHDVLVNYKDQGALLIVRKHAPVDKTIWCIGGKINRGMNTEDSLRKKVREECGLELKNITYHGTARLFFATDPFGHGKGHDVLVAMYFADGEGEINLDSMHEQPMFITPEKYTAKFRTQLHPYIKDYMDAWIKYIKR